MALVLKTSFFDAFLEFGKQKKDKHGRRQWGEGGPSWIFKHGTNIVDRGLKVLFFGPFLTIFRSFFP